MPVVDDFFTQLMRRRAHHRNTPARQAHRLRPHHLLPRHIFHQRDHVLRHAAQLDPAPVLPGSREAHAQVSDEPGQGVACGLAPPASFLHLPAVLHAMPSAAIALGGTPYCGIGFCRRGAWIGDLRCLSFGFLLLSLRRTQVQARQRLQHHRPRGPLRAAEVRRRVKSVLLSLPGRGSCVLCRCCGGVEPAATSLIGVFTAAHLFCRDLHQV